MWVSIAFSFGPAGKGQPSAGLCPGRGEGKDSGWGPMSQYPPPQRHVWDQIDPLGEGNEENIPNALWRIETFKLQ